jgi:hypothetical protein
LSGAELEKYLRIEIQAAFTGNDAILAKKQSAAVAKAIANLPGAVRAQFDADVATEIKNKILNVPNPFA